MQLKKIKIGDMITLYNEKNVNNIDYPFYGINIFKEFMPSVANTSNVDGSKYKIVKKGVFVFSGMQTGRDNCIRIAMYDREELVLVSPAYTTFMVSSQEVLPEYLFMIFRSKEKDRYGAFLSDGSVRSNLDWDVFCNIELEIPPIAIQRKYVNIYNGLLLNLSTYEAGLEDLKLVCDAFIEKNKKEYKLECLGEFIKQKVVKNTDGIVTVVKGLSTKKEFRDPNSRVNIKELKGYKIVKPNEFAFVQTTDTWKVLAFDYNKNDFDIVVSPVYEVFEITNDRLMSEYLSLHLRRSEFDRYARYHSWGSARENFTYSDMCDVQIPIPPISIQISIVNLHKVLDNRKSILNALKEKVSEICPILIRGSVNEAKGGN